LLLALERRRIAHPRLGTTPIFKEVLQQGFAIGGMGSGVGLHGSNPKPLMSALGHKQTSEQVRAMSALPPKADID
jgi:hypothetical protein